MNIAIIPAAGSGSRFGGQIPKQFIEIAGAPILVHTLRGFEEGEESGAIIVALRREEIERVERELCAHKIGKPVRLVAGGAERSDSILNALEEAKEFRPEVVAVHDAVRPLVTPERISAVVMKAREIGAAILALQATDTIKEVEDGLIRRTLDRRLIWRAQTPQVFRYDWRMRANREPRASSLPPAMATDDSFLVERLGAPVAIVEGMANNIKITTPEDLILAEKLLSA